MGIGKATEELIQLIDKTTGVVLEPTKTILQAKAEMKIERDKLRNEYKLKKIDIKERIKHRRFITELRRQHNLEEIGYKALEILPEYSEPQKISRDWINYFITSAQDVGEDELRTLWAKILAGEAGKPGIYSKRTLDYLKDFSVQDCKLFEMIIPFMIFEIQDEKEVPLLFIFTSDNNNFYTKFNIDYTDILCLKDIGILSQKSSCYFDPKHKYQWKYFSKILNVYNTQKKTITFDKVYPFTEVGFQLSTIIESKKMEEYLDFVKNVLLDKGLKIRVTKTLI